MSDGESWNNSRQFLTLLSSDGGGVRGLSLMILRSCSEATDIFGNRRLEDNVQCLDP
jgi:hypothetical protein